MFFYKEKYKWERQILIYEITLGWSLLSDEGLKNISQLEWLEASTTLSLFLLEKLIMLLSGAVHTRDESSQDRLRDMQTYRTTLASAYILCYLSAMWL